MIINSGGQIISHIRNSMVGRNISEVTDENNVQINQYIITHIDGQQVLISTVPVSNTNWKIMNIIPTKKLFDKIDYIRNAIILTIIIVAIAAFLVGIIIIKKIGSPLRMLQRKAVTVSKGNLNVSINAVGDDEIAELSRCFDNMLCKIRELIENIYHEQELKVDSEIKAYQAQINPHFLHNALNCIKWVAISQENFDIAEIIATLGNILESTMRNKTGTVKVSEEIKLMESYIRIQKFRYKDKFQIYFHIQEEIYDYYIPNLLLQPIVENSLFHGTVKKKNIQI
jgi:two-component system sensor histidine kinase YesM